jgi:ribonuclease Z
MTQPMFPLQDQLKGFSRALFATWIYHKRFNILFDAGEGVSTGLFNKVFGIRRIFLSHGHADHIAGLVNLLNIRNLGAGDQTASLKIYHPENNKLIEILKEYLKKTQQGLSFGLDWIPLKSGETIELEDQKSRIYVKTFKTKHSHKQLSLGYNVIEKRRRLKEEFSGLAQCEINALVIEKGRDAIAEDYDKILFTYGGDARPMNPDDFMGSSFLCHECTYLVNEDDERDFQQHSIINEVFDVAEAAGVENLLLFHLSLRYTRDQVREKIEELVAKKKAKFKVIVLYGDQLFDAMNPETLKSRKRRNNKSVALKA